MMMMVMVVPMMPVMVADGNNNLGGGTRDSKDCKNGDKQANEQNSQMLLDHK